MSADMTPADLGKLDRRKRREIQAILKKKAKHGLLPPQKCRNCGRSLRDESVPPEYEWSRLMWSLAVTVQTASGSSYECPFCGAKP
jgi:hypothetical protein